MTSLNLDPCTPAPCVGDTTLKGWGGASSRSELALCSGLALLSGTCWSERINRISASSSLSRTSSRSLSLCFQPLVLLPMSLSPLVVPTSTHGMPKAPTTSNVKGWAELDLCWNQALIASSDKPLQFGAAREGTTTMSIPPHISSLNRL